MVNLSSPLSPLDERLCYDVHAPLLKCIGGSLFLPTGRPAGRQRSRKEKKRDVFEDDIEAIVPETNGRSHPRPRRADGAAADWYLAVLTPVLGPIG